MRKVAAIIAVIAALGIWSSQGLAVDPPPDLGEPSAIVAACQALGDIVTSNGARLRYCRRAAPDESLGNSTVVHVKLATSLGDFRLKTTLRKTLWQTVTTSEE